MILLITFLVIVFLIFVYIAVRKIYNEQKIKSGQRELAGKVRLRNVQNLLNSLTYIRR